jgi:hypothetical protein
MPLLSTIKPGRPVYHSNTRFVLVYVKRGFRSAVISSMSTEIAVSREFSKGIWIVSPMYWCKCHQGWKAKAYRNAKILTMKGEMIKIDFYGEIGFRETA